MKQAAETFNQILLLMRYHKSFICGAEIMKTVIRKKTAFSLKKQRNFSVNCAARRFPEV